MITKYKYKQTYINVITKELNEHADYNYTISNDADDYAIAMAENDHYIHSLKTSPKWAVVEAYQELVHSGVIVE